MAFYLKALTFLKRTIGFLDYFNQKDVTIGLKTKKPPEIQEVFC